MASLLNMSGGSLLKKGLPYDAEIEYLECTGTQYIDTLFKGNTTTTTLNISLMLKPKEASQAVFGSRNKPYSADVASANVFAYCSGSNGYFRIDWAAARADASTVIPCSPNIIYNIEVTRGYFKINDTIYNFSDRTSINQNYNFLIGSFSNGSTPYNVGLDGRIYSAKLYNNGLLIMDFIPVRVGSTGYMYDKVSGQLFGNQGTGDFILGADKQ